MQKWHRFILLYGHAGLFSLASFDRRQVALTVLSLRAGAGAEEEVWQAAEGPG